VHQVGHYSDNTLILSHRAARSGSTDRHHALLYKNIEVKRHNQYSQCNIVVAIIRVTAEVLQIHFAPVSGQSGRAVVYFGSYEIEVVSVAHT